MKRNDVIRRVDLHIIMVIMGIYISFLIVANVLASKLFFINGRWAMTAGVIAYPITFLMTDIVNEVWGKSVAQRFVAIGFLANLLMVGLFAIGVWLPPAPFWGDQVAFQTVLGSVPRMVLASMAAYLVSQTWDVWVFHLIKKKSRLGLWFRNNLSTITSQVIDSAIFMTIAFAGTMTAPELWIMFITYMVVKGIIALLDTPLCYIGVRIVENKRGKQ